MRRVAFLLVLAAAVCGSAGAQPAPRVCCNFLQSFPHSWTADGSRVYMWSNLGTQGGSQLDLFVMNADGTGLEQVLPERTDGEYLRAADGRRVAFLARDGVLYSIDEAGTEQNVIATGVTRFGSVSPDGRRYAYSVAVSLKTAFTSVVEIPGGQKRGIGIGFNPLFSPDGSKLAVEDDDLAIVYDVETGRELFASYCCYNPERPVFSPDSTRAAFSAASIARGDDAGNLYVVDLRTGESFEIGPGYHIDSWSPDGSRIAYQGRFGVETIRGDGTGRQRLLDHVYHFRFSPDWTRYAFSVLGPLLGNDLYIGVVGEGRPKRVTPSQCTVVSDDCLAGGSGDDRLEGGHGRNVIFGGPGDDRISGGKGDDLVDAELGQDHLSGGPGKDELFGGFGNDRVRGGPGPDMLAGGMGADRLEGGDGADDFYGNPGQDVISGGKGPDLIVADRYDDRDRITCGPGVDRVRADRTDRVARDCERVRFRRDP